MDLIDIAVAVAILVGSVGGVTMGAVFGWMALKNWIRHSGGRDLAEVEELRGVVGQLTGELVELQERVDFLERVLASRREAPQLRERS